MADHEYKSVPVSVAKEISDNFDKSMVVIAAWDPVFGMLHTTTFGRTDQEKEWAAKAGEMVTQVLGADPAQAIRHEDFRPCAWCGKTLNEHEEDYPGRPVPRVPCLLLKSGYKPG